MTEPEKYVALLKFTEWARDQGCDLIAGIDCIPCKAKETLEKLGS